jgi:ATP/maltotriose-dependent transcriptional regulator MalT
MLEVRTQPHAGGLRKERAIPSHASARLAEAALRPIAVVVAPGGFGKSALLHAFGLRPIRRQLPLPSTS